MTELNNQRQIISNIPRSLINKYNAFLPPHLIISTTLPNIYWRRLLFSPHNSKYSPHSSHNNTLDHYHLSCLSYRHVITPYILTVPRLASKIDSTIGIGTSKALPPPPHRNIILLLVHIYQYTHPFSPCRVYFFSYTSKLKHSKVYINTYTIFILFVLLQLLSSILFLLSIDSQPIIIPPHICIIPSSKSATSFLGLTSAIPVVQLQQISSYHALFVRHLFCHSNQFECNKLHTTPASIPTGRYALHPSPQSFNLMSTSMCTRTNLKLLSHLALYFVPHYSSFSIGKGSTFTNRYLAIRSCQTVP